MVGSYTSLWQDGKGYKCFITREVISNRLPPYLQKQSR